MKPHAIIIDDEEAVCWAISRALRSEGYDTSTAPSAEVGLQLIEERPPDVVFLDIRLPGRDGLSALQHLQQLHASVPVIIMTAYGDLSTAVEALKGGAFDYLVKPFDLSQVLRAAENARQRQSTNQPLNNRPANPNEEIIGQSSAMQEVFKRIAMVAPHSAGVLITGESGVGKELVARAIHRHSSRANGPFIAVHAAALNSATMESELFGQTFGHEIRPGLLAGADGGTVFVDEVAEISLSAQGKLLRALELGEVLPVGGHQPMRFNFRVITATAANLEQLVEEQRFRQDLYFRLNVFRIHLPALRDRLDDLPILATYFLKQFAPQSPPISTETMDYLRQQYWPGNVREFRNAVERATIIARGGPLTPEHFREVKSVPSNEDADLASAVRRWLNDLLATNPQAKDLTAEMLKIVEPVLIEEVMQRTSGNRSLAGEWLGLDRATVRKKIQQYGLESEAN